VARLAQGGGHTVVWWQGARGANLTGGVALVLELAAWEESEDRGLALGSRATNQRHELLSS